MLRGRAEGRSEQAPLRRTGDTPVAGYGGEYLR